jgi:glycerophosphoryl diester phosphodiesterase
VEESLLRSKKGCPTGGGDRIIQGPRFVGILDAATEKFHQNWIVDNRSMNGEQAIATILHRALEEEEGSIWDALGRAQHELLLAARRSAIDLAVPGADPLAAFVVLDIREGKIFSLGDCSYGLLIPGEEFKPTCATKVVDNLAARARAEHIRRLSERNALNPTVDQGRAFIEEELKSAAALANKNPDDVPPNEILFGRQKRFLVYHMFSATSVPVLEVTKLSHRHTGCVFASDGYPLLFPTLQESEHYLHLSIAEDPSRTGEHPATKGVRPGNKSFDDRSFIRVSFT